MFLFFKGTITTAVDMHPSIIIEMNNTGPFSGRILMAVISTVGLSTNDDTWIAVTMDDDHKVATAGLLQN